MKRPDFQLVASLIAMVMIANLQYAWTLFVGPIRAQHGWQQSEVQGAFTLFILLQTFVQPLDGWLMDRMGPRVLITLAGILCGLGWSLMGYASSLTELHLYYAVADVGVAFVYSGCIGSALKWHPHRRGFASGVIAAGFGSGSALFNLVIQNHLLPTYGYQAAFLWTGLVQGAIIALVAQFLCHPDASFMPPSSTAAARSTASRRNPEIFNTRQMLAKPHFYVLYATFVTVATGGLYLTANQKDCQRLGTVVGRQRDCRAGALGQRRQPHLWAGFLIATAGKTPWSSPSCCRRSAWSRCPRWAARRDPCSRLSWC